MTLTVSENDISSENESIKSENESDAEEKSNENDSSSDVASVKSENISESNEGSDDEELGNKGWADSVAKILKTNKPKGKKTIVLSKAKKLTDVRREKPREPGFQIDGEIKEEKPDPLELLDQIKQDEPVRKKQRKETVKVRVKPSILERERERTLTKIATRGVVQLFNAVRTQQKDLQDKLEDAGPLERNKDKVLKSIDKRQFLNVLMGAEESKSQPVDGDVKRDSEEDDNGAQRVEKRPQKRTNSTSTWNVLRDDFMLSAKFKDWDKQADDEVEDV